MALVYLGSSTDAYPLCWGPILGEHDTFVLVDAEIDPADRPIEAVAEALKSQAKLEVERVDAEKNELWLPGGKRVVFIAGVEDADLPEDPEFKAIAPAARTLFLRDWSPEPQVFEALPALVRIFATTSTASAVPAERRQLLMPLVVEASWDEDEGDFALTSDNQMLAGALSGEDEEEDDEEDDDDEDEDEDDEDYDPDEEEDESEEEEEAAAAEEAGSE